MRLRRLQRLCPARRVRLRHFRPRHQRHRRRRRPRRHRVKIVRPEPSNLAASQSVPATVNPSCANSYPPSRGGSTCDAWMCVTCDTEVLCQCDVVVVGTHGIANGAAASNAPGQAAQQVQRETERIISTLASASYRIDASGGAGSNLEAENLRARAILRVTADRNPHSQQCLHVPAHAQGSSDSDDADPTFRPVDFYRSRADLINESL